jgi:L-lactate dehydrogenase complex protein LldF
MHAMNMVLSRPGLFKTAGGVGRWVMRAIPAVVNNRLNPWYKQREMPAAPKESFADWHRKNRK